MGIQPPPDHIFKFRKRRHNVAESVWSDGTVSYIPDHAEYIDGKGNFVHYRGYKGVVNGVEVEMPAPLFPSKTVAPVDAIYAVSPIKRKLINDLQFLGSRIFLLPILSTLFLGKGGRAKILNRYLELLNNYADVTATPFYLEDGYYSKVVKEIIKGTQAFLVGMGVNEKTATKSAEIIGMMFEYDNAYRCRIQDVLNEANPELFWESAPKEIERLLKLMLARDPAPDLMGFKFDGAVKGLKYAWYLPSIRAAIRSGVSHINFENCKIDEGDTYHNLLYGSYNFQGKSLDERIQIYQAIHGKDMNKWPPRIMIKNNI